MPLHSKTDPEFVWPYTLPVPARVDLQTVLSARKEATDLYKSLHPGTKQDAIPHKKFLTLLGVQVEPTIFSRLVSEKGYPGATAGGYLRTLAAAVTQWRMARAAAQRTPERSIHKLSFYQEILEAAEGAAAMEERHIQERGVVLLAPTGAGKTTLGQWLREQLGRCHIVSAHESWRNSYFAVLASILTSLGQQVPNSARKAETALLSFLNANKLTLVFDEQDFFGRSALNLIRQLLNETRTSIIMLMVPETWDRVVRDGGEYASQFCRRCSTVKKAPAITAADAKVFLRECLADTSPETLTECAKIMAREANTFGSVSLLDNVSAFLGDYTAQLPENQTLPEATLMACKHYHLRHQLSINIAAA